MEVEALLLSIDPSKAQGPDQIPARLLKECAQEISESLCLLFNKSFHTGIFPQQWKLANIVPILKKCPASNVQNYRPISLLSNIGKIFERCVFNRVINHISNQLHNFQHGFLKGKSCTTHLLQVIDEIGKSLDCAEQTDIIYLDFAKAFDKVNHSLLLDKISGFGIDGNLLKWFGNYLSDRRQQVTIPGSTSGVFAGALRCTSGVDFGTPLVPHVYQ